MSSYHYPCLVYRQRPDSQDAPTFCIFQAPVAEILQWAAIKRLAEEPGAPQRRTNPVKLAAIKNFLITEPKNTIPTSVTLAIRLPEEEMKRLITTATQNHATLNIAVEGEPKPGLVIDGQHRLLGINEFNPHCPVTVVALLNADDAEIAFQFLVINYKATRVSTDLFRALALHYKEAQLETRLKTARLTLDQNVRFVGMVDVEESSPFKGIIAWDNNPEAQRIVAPTAIEASISYIQHQKVKALESDDVLLEFFYAIWRTVQQRWSSLWNKKDSRLLKKFGVLGISQYMTDALVTSYDWSQWDISDPVEVTKQVEVLLRYQARQFWEVPWPPSSYDTQSGRALIVESLVQIARNLRAGGIWYEDVKLVDVSQLEVAEVENHANEHSQNRQ
jgi:DGQHR domain-containing protein